MVQEFKLLSLKQHGTMLGQNTAAFGLKEMVSFIFIVG